MKPELIRLGSMASWRMFRACPVSGGGRPAGIGTRRHLGPRLSGLVWSIAALPGDQPWRAEHAPAAGYRLSPRRPAQSPSRARTVTTRAPVTSTGRRNQRYHTINPSPWAGQLRTDQFRLSNMPMIRITRTGKLVLQIS